MNQCFETLIAFPFEQSKLNHQFELCRYSLSYFKFVSDYPLIFIVLLVPLYGTLLTSSRKQEVTKSNNCFAEWNSDEIGYS